MSAFRGRKRAFPARAARPNVADKGDWHSVQLARGHRPDDGWRDSDRLGSDDLLSAAELLDQAHTWVVRQLAADAKSRRYAEAVVP